MDRNYIWLTGSLGSDYIHGTKKVFEKQIETDEGIQKEERYVDIRYVFLG